jgi:hypothetical protein
MSSSDEMMALHVGTPWTAWSLPTDGPSAAWHHPHLLVISVPDPSPRLTEALPESRVRLGILQTQSLAVLLIRADVLGTIECPRPYLIGDDEPEITYGEGEHILWKLVLVQAGIITNIRAFTTSPQITRHVRRIFSEQRAEGPITPTRFEEILDDWYKSVRDDRTAWSRCLATCYGGD